MPMFLLYVYISPENEGATIFSQPFAKVESLKGDSAMEVVKLFSDYMVNGEDNATAKARLQERLSTATTEEQIADIIYDECCVSFDKVAIVEEKGGTEETLFKVGEALGDTMGSDSSTYAACANWGRVLESHAVMTTDFPYGIDSDERAEENKRNT